MLTYNQKLHLVKNVDCHALSSARRDALPGYFVAFPGDTHTNEDLTAVADMICLSPEYVRVIAGWTTITG
ncbi:hypothetical protein M0R72_15295 [Candidatus Pacearchaeota archaeon]|jgi:hypothetical protein|nr:hypothetical protein [Candidatus Pacearchaeota archaeon]